MACEGESTEPDYLQYLNEQFGDGDDSERLPFRIQPVYRKNGMTPSAVVEAARSAAGEDEAWALFDRDQWDDIPQAVRDAARSRVEFALSHPLFDLWLLLHFQAFGGTQSGTSTLVVEKLRRATGADAFHDYDKRGEKSLRRARCDALYGREQHAAMNARRLVTLCPHGHCEPGKAKSGPVGETATTRSAMAAKEWAARSGHAPDCPVLRRDPSTDVWRLLARLGIV